MPSQQPASIRDVAERAGVALGTVSNVLNRPEKVATATRDRVLSAIEELGFVRNDAARQLRAGHSRTIGLIVLNVGNPFFTELGRGAEDRALQDNLSVLLGNTDGSADRESAYLDLFEEQRVMGLLISPAADVSVRLDRMQRRGTPAVLVDRRAADAHISSVSVDDRAGGYQAAQHLIGQGCRRLAFIGGPFSILQLGERLEGARVAVAAADGVDLELIEVGQMTAEAGVAVGEQVIGRAAADRPDGIFVANDLVAVGLLQSLVYGGAIAVPDDIAVVGYDDIGFASMTAVPLSSVRQPTKLIGRTAVELLLAEAAAMSAGRDVEHQQIVFQPELVVRASSRRH